MQSNLTHYDNYTYVNDFDIIYHAKLNSFNVTTQNNIHKI